ncbi:MAG: ribosome silencing factor [Chloroflexaceae bacterium]|nr:ribosome silencing factor [Chloroflexaceae bacterium]
MNNDFSYHDNTSVTFLTQPGAEVSAQHLAQTIATAADERKAADITLLDVSEVSYLTDCFVIATGFSRTQVRAIADAIETTVAETWGRQPRRVEGKAEASWVLLDYGDVIVHLFLPQEREFYHLEAFWGHAKRLPVQRALDRQP